MELAIVELDTGAKLDATECAEVAGVELVGGTNLDGGRGTWMERGRNGRHKYGAGGTRSGEAAPVSGSTRIRPGTASRTT
jgi:hypothetical protein